tara:strand:- start:120 stop:575 length:456 start_codon:yes stop_codon:yes gene_type:complete
MKTTKDLQNEWITALVKRSVDNPWENTLLCIATFGIWIVFHSVQRRTLTIFFYSFLWWISLNLSLLLWDEYLSSLLFKYLDRPYLFGYAMVYLFLWPFWVKTAIKHDKKVAKDLLKDNLEVYEFSLFNLLGLSLKKMLKDFQIILRFLNKI